MNTNPTVSVVVDGETLTLRPSLNAMLAVSAIAGGIQPTLERVGKLDIEAIATVIAAGSGRAASRDLMEAVYQTGILNVVAPVIDFIVLLRNGGKANVAPAPDTREDDGKNG